MRRLLLICLLFPVCSFAQLSMVELEVKPVPEPMERDSEVENWNKSQAGYAELPEQAKQMLYWTNLCRHNPKKFWETAITPILAGFPDLNKQEAKSLKTDLLSTGQLPMFLLNSSLIQTAQYHSVDIGGKRAPLSHNSTDGSDFGARMKRAGIRKCASENISLCSHTVLLSVVLLYLDIGLKEMGHRHALLDKNLQEIGIGSAPYGKDKDQYFLVQDFACLQ